MSKKEVIAYAITHAPPGVKGGPYVADMGYAPVPDLAHAWRSPASDPERARAESKKRRGTRVIRIVRKARPSRLCDACGFLIEAESRRRAPSEASAVEVLRELVASLASREGLADNVLDFVAHTFDPGIGSPQDAWVRVLHEYGTVITRAEKAERERDEALGRAQSETEWRVRAVSERQDAEAERDDLRAKLARLTAPGEGSDEELVAIAETAYEAAGRGRGGCVEAAALAVAAHVRQERVLVRARPTQQPSEASAVEVLRELVAYPGNGGDLARIQARARCVLAASGPDPSEVVRAAIAWRDWDATPDTTTDADLSAAVDAYRKAGGK